MQTAWVNWVVSGQKYNVDFTLGMIDVNSIMSRIKSSEESLRNPTIPDAYGSSEVYGASLTPNRWATYCKQEAKGWCGRNGKYTLAQLDSEIARLESLLELYKTAESLIESKDVQKYPAKSVSKPAVDPETTEKTVAENLSALY